MSPVNLAGVEFASSSVARTDTISFPDDSIPLAFQRFDQFAVYMTFTFSIIISDIVCCVSTIIVYTIDFAGIVTPTPTIIGFHFVTFTQLVILLALETNQMLLDPHLSLIIIIKNIESAIPTLSSNHTRIPLVASAIITFNLGAFLDASRSAVVLRLRFLFFQQAELMTLYTFLLVTIIEINIICLVSIDAHNLAGVPSAFALVVAFNTVSFFHISSTRISITISVVF